jgi:hypothetical protein
MAAEIRGLQDALRAIGKGRVFAGDPFTAGGLKEIGRAEGEITAEHNAEYNDYTAPEHMGPGIIRRRLQGENVVVNIPLIMGDPAYWSELSPTGNSHSGYSRPQTVVETSLVILPESELGYDENAETPEEWSYDGTDWTPAAPEHALWIWRGHFEAPNSTFRDEDGGKVIETVTFQSMVDLDRPEGHKLYTRGDPTEYGIDVVI